MRCVALIDRYSSTIAGELILQQFKKFEAGLRHFLHVDPDPKDNRRNFMPKLGLEALVTNLLKENFLKSNYLHAFGDWEAFDLSREMKLYAAADAAASLDVGLYILKNTCNTPIELERPYDHNEMRELCLDRITEMAPEMWQILPDYYGSSKCSKESAVESSVDHKPENIKTQEKDFKILDSLIGFFLIVALCCICYHLFKLHRSSLEK